MEKMMLWIPSQERFDAYTKMEKSGKYTEEELRAFLFEGAYGIRKVIKDEIEKAREEGKNG